MCTCVDVASYGGVSWTGGKSCFIATNTQLDKYKLNQFLLRDFFGHMLTNELHVFLS